MKKLLKSLLLLCLMTHLLSFNLFKTNICNATWYDTTPYPTVHRVHSTAAISRNLIQKMGLTVGNKIKDIKGSFLIVTNLYNNKIDTVEVTDVCGNINHIDLSKKSFGKLDNHGRGRIKVVVKKYI